jgi:hypothetical protein
MVSSTAYYIKFDGFSPTFFNQFLVVVILSISCVNLFLVFYYDYEGMAFITFVQNSLYPRGNNVSKDEGL